jgi:hypothetical protein
MHKYYKIGFFFVSQNILQVIKNSINKKQSSYNPVTLGILRLCEIDLIRHQNVFD